MNKGEIEHDHTYSKKIKLDNGCINQVSGSVAETETKATVSAIQCAPSDEASVKQSRVLKYEIKVLNNNLYLSPGLFDFQVDKLMVQCLNDFGFQTFPESNRSLIWFALLAHIQEIVSVDYKLSLTQIEIIHRFQTLDTEFQAAGDQLHMGSFSVANLFFKLNNPSFVNPQIRMFVSALEAFEAMTSKQQSMFAALVTTFLPGLSNDLSDYDIENIISSLSNDVVENFSKTFQTLYHKRPKKNIISEIVETIANDKFPTSSHIYELLFDQFHFFNVKQVSQMRYSTATKEIAYLIHRTCGGAVLRLLTGYKTDNDEVKPSSARCILVLPNEENIRDYKPMNLDVPDAIDPGFRNDLLESYISNSKHSNYVLKYDGRSIRPGFIGDCGDVDLGGAETGKTLKEQRALWQGDIDALTIASKTLASFNTQSNEKTNLVVAGIIECVQTMQNCITRDVALDGELHKQLLKYKKMGGENWQKSPYKRAVTFYTGLIQKLGNYKEESLKCKDLLIQHVAGLQDIQYASVHGSVHEASKHVSITASISTDNHIKLPQRSDEWFSFRSQFCLTGSMLYNASGMDGGKGRLSEYARVHEGKEKTFNPTVTKALHHGNIHEIDAVATLIYKIMPAYFPDLSFEEVGSFVLPGYLTQHIHEDGKCITSKNSVPLCLISPDGVLTKDGEVQYVVEIKCPYFKNKPHVTVPQRYLPQLEAEMAATNAKGAIFVSYADTSTTLFICRPHPEYLHYLLCNLQENFVDGPKKISAAASKVAELKEFNKQVSSTIVFIGEFNSVHNTPELVPPTPNHPDCQMVCSTLEACVTYVSNVRQLHRERATESVTFLLSNTDRHDVGQGHGVQVGYILANKRNTIADYRAVLQLYLSELQKVGVEVSVISFDGEFHSLLSFGLKNEALTLFSFQRRFWQQTSKMKKSECMAVLKNSGASVKVSLAKEGKCMEAHVNYLGAEYLVKEPNKPHKSSKKTDNKEDRMGEESEMHESERPFDIPVQNFEEALLHLPYAYEVEVEVEEENEEDHKETDIVQQIIILQMDFLNESSKLKSMDPETLSIVIQNDKALSQSCTVVDLKSILKWLKSVHPHLPKSMYTLSGTKDTLISNTQRIIDHWLNQSSNECQWHDFEFGQLSSDHLSMIVAQVTIDGKYTQWVEEGCVAQEVEVICGDDKFQIPVFLQPERSETGLRLFLEDDHHLCARVRKQLLTNQIEGIDVQAWMNVATAKTKTLLTVPIMKGADPQSADFAKITFSVEVETVLKELGFEEESKFCAIMRGFMEATDKRGMSSSMRVRLLVQLRNWLLEGWDLHTLPPPNRIKGLPAPLAESLIASIDGHIYLYALVKSGTYNVRSVGTNDNESLHAIEHGLCHSSGGVPSAHQLRNIKATSYFINTMLMKSNAIPFRHARKPKYELNIGKGTADLQNECNDYEASPPPSSISKIIVKDHQFDIEETKGKKLRGISQWLKPPRRMRGVRGLMAYDESTCPLSQRM